MPLGMFVICVTLMIVGLNQVRAAYKRINERLPSHCRIANPTGHTGRHSFTSACANAGVDVTTVALATKHKTSSAVRRYIHPTDELKVQPALKVARRLAEDELLEDVELEGDV